MIEHLQIRIHGDTSLPTLVYLPGMHGDWTLVSSFRAAIAGRVRFVEFAYPRTVTWSLEDYAAGIEEALLANGIERGWLLGESFGSQPTWALIARGQNGRLANQPERRPPIRRVEDPSAPIQAGTESGVPIAADLPPRHHFHAQGLILSGGFVRHPVNWAVRLAGQVSGAMPLRCVKLFCVAYASYAKFRHKHAPETLASIGEFVANRTQESDRRAIVHRYAIIADNDLRSVARQFALPVYYLAGLVDPLVPWPFVRRWLRRNCPGYRGGKMIWRADHNVLGTAPKKSAEQILAWISETGLSHRGVELSTGSRQTG